MRYVPSLRVSAPVPAPVTNTVTPASGVLVSPDVTLPVTVPRSCAAARVPVAIVSGAFRAEIEPVVAAAGIAGELSMIVSADDVEHGKPHPEGYLLAVDGLGVDPARTVAFEDTEAGVSSAKDAGLRCLAVRGTLPDERLGRADELIDAIDVALVERLIG